MLLSDSVGNGQRSTLVVERIQYAIFQFILILYFFTVHLISSPSYTGILEQRAYHFIWSSSFWWKV